MSGCVETAPSVIVLGGPNGAGKSSVATRLVRDELSVLDFVNADVIASGLSAFCPEAAAFQAGRIMLQRLDELAESGKTFAFESTLASRTFEPWIRSLKSAHGYRFRLVYVWVRSVELSVSRVSSRVEGGGHVIAEETIRRRYRRSVRNLFDLYLPLADQWEIFDNSGCDGAMLVADGAASFSRIVNSDLWKCLRACYDAGADQSKS